MSKTNYFEVPLHRSNKPQLDWDATTVKVGDLVDRAKGTYGFPGTVVSVFTNSQKVMYAVVEMDEFHLLHIFKVNQLQLRKGGDHDRAGA